MPTNVTAADAERWARELLGWEQVTASCWDTAGGDSGAESLFDAEGEWWRDLRFLWPLRIALEERGYVIEPLKTERGLLFEVWKRDVSLEDDDIGRRVEYRQESVAEAALAAAMIESPRPGLSREWHEKRIAEEEGHDVLAGSIESPREEEG